MLINMSWAFVRTRDSYKFLMIINLLNHHKQPLNNYFILFPFYTGEQLKFLAWGHTSDGAGA